MALFITTIIILAIALFLAEAGILVWIEKLFKIEKPTYRNSLKTLLFYCIATIGISLIVGFIDTDYLSEILITVVSFFTFHYLIKKYYLTSWKKSLGIYIVFGVIGTVLLFIVVIPTRMFMFEPFVVTGEAMSPTYINGDYLLINKITRKYNRGDVIVFARESGIQSSYVIERIVGLPLEKIEIKNGEISIDGKIISDYSESETAGNISVTLGKDEYFVLGDNRLKSLDSRSFGPIPRLSIEGEVFYKVSGISLDSIQDSHIKGNVPESAIFEQYLKRDLNAYFTEYYKQTVDVQYEFLREGATQSGVAYPKYYLWVKISSNSKEIDQGAIRVAAINKTQFSVTNFLTKSEITKNPNSIYSVFPEPVCKKIETDYLK